MPSMVCKLTGAQKMYPNELKPILFHSISKQMNVIRWSKSHFIGTLADILAIGELQIVGWAVIATASDFQPLPLPPNRLDPFEI